MSSFEFSLKGKFSYTRRDIEIEELNVKADLSEGETEKWTETLQNVVNSIQETNKFAATKDREIRKIEDIQQDVKETSRVTNLKVMEVVSAIKNAVADFKFESAEAKKSLTSILKNVIENSSMSREEKDKISAEIFNIANGYAKASAKMNSIFNKFEK